ncbi:MAG TPA: hypothetical protein DD490_14345 [Acidobacteria bacterium]|nr:hypothetical protein [Acidobacteriota bacterium]
MPPRKGFILAMDGRKLFTFGNAGGTSILPVFSSEASLSIVHGRIPIPPDGVLVRFEVWADTAGSLKLATLGGGLRDLQLDWSHLRSMWDTEPEFQQELELGLAQMKARSSGPGTSGATD